MIGGMQAVTAVGCCKVVMTTALGGRWLLVRSAVMSVSSRVAFILTDALDDGCVQRLVLVSVLSAIN